MIRRASPSRFQSALASEYIDPMHPRAGAAFDADGWLFEVKWDGTRAVAYVESGKVLLMNRRRLDIGYRYPEFNCLRRLPGGTILDGEIVVLRNGKPDFSSLESREHTSTAARIDRLSRTLPAAYVVFDCLYDRYEPLLKLPLSERRARLVRVIKQAKLGPRVIVSDGVECHGVDCFEEAMRQGLEGIVAKRLDSRYVPGKRTDAWVKIKRQERVECAIVGFVPEGKDDYSALIIAAEVNGKVACVGKVGTGFDKDLRKRINRLLWPRLRARPVLPCKERGLWIEPGVYCAVRCMERTASGGLRAPVFEKLYASADADAARRRQ